MIKLIKSVDTWGWAEDDCKEAWENCLSVTWAHAFVKTCLTVLIKWLHFILYKVSHSKVGLSKKII